MGNRATLQPNVFSSENQPARRGRPKGSPNRATVFKRLLKLKTIDVLPEKEVREIEADLTLLEAAALGQVLSARKGNTNAWKEIQDTLHGKQTEKIEQSGETKVTVVFKKADDNDGD